MFIRLPTVIPFQGEQWQHPINLTEFTNARNHGDYQRTKTCFQTNAARTAYSCDNTTGRPMLMGEGGNPAVQRANTSLSEKQQPTRNHNQRETTTSEKPQPTRNHNHQETTTSEKPQLARNYNKRETTTSGKLQPART